jgi:hypothetical protein
LSRRPAAGVYIFIDESGTFTTSDKTDSWCVIAAYVWPEFRRAQIDRLIRDLRTQFGAGKEVKLRDMPVDRYIRLLVDLEPVGGIAFAVAVDVSLHSEAAIIDHRERQAEKVLENIPRMHLEAGKQMLRNLASDIRSLPPQLYTQALAQIELFHWVLIRAPLYFVQRHPPSLGHFRWRLDGKDKGHVTDYEELFQRILPMILQTKSLTEPMMELEGEDYRHLQRFEFPLGKEPHYLTTTYGIELKSRSTKLDVGKMIRDDFHYVDSNEVAGVQVADLLAAGLRRLLRGGFEERTNDVARSFGANTLQGLRGEYPVKFVSLDQEGEATDRTAHVMRLIREQCRPMVLRA